MLVITPEDEKDPDKMSKLLAAMSTEELDRYEHYRRSKLNKKAMSTMIKEILPTQHQSIDETVVIAVSGLAKMYVGDLVRNARRRIESQIEPLTPEQLLAAARSIDLDQRDLPLLAECLRPRSHFHDPPIFSSAELL
mmetsp:Transcript_15156/g.20051  ORF Transcript_15156/g.20051 Transcript_15156/m.20051 type:complete len:137 (-) Transcript_15156:3578-3988(-)